MAAAPRRWGWHRLDPHWAELLVRDAGIPPGATVLDVGAGTGPIASALLNRGARVVAVEAHPDRAAKLRRRFGPQVRVVKADGADLWLPRQPYYVVANPPFSITSALVRRLLQPGSRLIGAHLILQVQAVRRWTRPDAPGAARWKRDFEAVAGRSIPRSAFTPPPSTSCRVLAIVRRDAHVNRSQR